MNTQNITRSHRKSLKARSRRRPIPPMKDAGRELVANAGSAAKNQLARQQKRDNFYKRISQRGVKTP